MLKVEDFVTNLDVPWEMAFAPDGRIFVTERPCAIRIISGGRLQSEPWLTLDVAAVGEGGLLGLALDPGFSDNHYVYVAYTYATSRSTMQNRLVRLREDPTTKTGLVDRVLLDNAGADVIHDGGCS